MINRVLDNEDCLAKIEVCVDNGHDLVVLQPRQLRIELLVVLDLDFLLAGDGHHNLFSLK